MTKLIYGPFRVAVGGAAFATLLLCTGAIILAASSAVIIHCRRVDGADERSPTCEMTRWSVRGRRHASFVLQSVAIQEHTRGRGKNVHKEGRLILTDTRGRTHRAVSVDIGEAEQARADLGALLDGSGPGELRVVTRDPIWFGALGAGIVLFGVWMVRAALRGGGRVRVEISADRRTLALTRTFFAIPISRRQEDISGAGVVGVDWGRLPAPWQKGRDTGEPAGRVFVETPRGRVALIRPYARGQRVHARMAESLREALGLAPSTAAAHASPAIAPARALSRTARGLFIVAAVWFGGGIGFTAGVFRSGGGPYVDYRNPFTWCCAALGAAAAAAVVFYLTRPERLDS